MKREKEMLQERLMKELDLHQDLSDEEILSFIEREVLKRCREIYLTIEQRQALKKELFDSLRGYDVLSGLMEDEDISEIMINGSTQIFVERFGKMERIEKSFSGEERLRNIIQKIVSGCNRMVNEASPVVDARLEDGSRVNVVLPPVALDGSIMTIRKFPKEFFTMDKLIAMESITKEAAQFLEILVKARLNLFISGGTGCGKTTFLNVLSNYIPREERVITIEDSAELQIKNVDNLVRLETRNANVEGENEITMSQLIKAALRMRPDRIIVGEVRDAAAMDMANSMLTGHDGSISTGHGNSAKEMLLRLETMILMGYDMPVLAIRQHLAAAIDVIIHLGRLRDNTRRVMEIREILGVENGEIVTKSLYEFREKGIKNGKIVGALVRTGDLENLKKINQSGIGEEVINGAKGL